MNWISVEEKLPQDMQKVIGFYSLKDPKKDFVGEVRYNGKEFQRDYNTYESFVVFITHWMPLPEPPK